MIVLIRHGSAVVNFDSDPTRELTDEGRNQIKQRRDYLKNLNITFDIGMVSPYIRTLQSYEILRKDLKINKTNITKELLPNASYDIADYLRFLNDDGKNVIVVSHMPLVGYITSSLCGSQVHNFFDPGDMYILEYDNSTKNFKVIHSTNIFSLE